MWLMGKFSNCKLILQGWESNMILCLLLVVKMKRRRSRLSLREVEVVSLWLTGTWEQSYWCIYSQFTRKQNRLIIILFWVCHRNLSLITDFVELNKKISVNLNLFDYHWSWGHQINCIEDEVFIEFIVEVLEHVDVEEVWLKDILNCHLEIWNILHWV